MFWKSLRRIDISSSWYVWLNSPVKPFWTIVFSFGDYYYYYYKFCFLLGFPGSSDGKDSTCNAGDPSSMPGSGRSPGEGIGFPLQYSWASLVAQTVKNVLVIWDTWVPSLGWEDPLEKGTATHSSILPWRIPWTEEPGWVQPVGSQRVGHD